MFQAVAPSLKGQRVYLRSYHMDDFEAFAALHMSSRAQYMDGPFSRTEAWFRFGAGAGRWRLVGYGAWTIAWPDETQPIGFISLNPSVTLEAEHELGWGLYDGYEGQGFAHEAAGLALNFAFETLGWAQCISYIERENHRSIRLAERLGATIDPNATSPDGDKTLVYRHFKT